MSRMVKNGEFNTNLYLKSLAETGRPISLNELPPYRYDMRGISNYAKAKGVSVSDLSNQEKEMFKFAIKKAE